MIVIDNPEVTVHDVPVITVVDKIMLLFDFSAPEQWKAKEKKTAK